MDRFSMEDDDNCGGRWMDGEFHYRALHPQTKEAAFYENFEDLRTRKRKRNWEKSDLKFVNFVSTTGIVHSVELIKKSKLEPVNFESTTEICRSVEEKVEKVEVAQENQNAAEGPALGVEVATSSHTRNVKVVEEKYEDFVPTTEFGRQIVKAARRKQKEREEREQEAKASTSSSNEISAGTSKFGTFEEHTKAIGMKLLKQMGYKGGGLGKDAQGIAAPIEAKLRPWKMGMGFDGFQESDCGLEQLPSAGEVEEPTAKQSRKEEKLWHIKNVQSRVKFKTSSRKTAGRLLIEKEGVKTVQPVLDIREPVVKVLTSFKTLNVQQGANQDDPPLTEVERIFVARINDLAWLRRKPRVQKLVHKSERKTKVQKLVEKSEKKIAVLKLKHSKNLVQVYFEEAKLLQRDLLSQKQHIASLGAIASSIQNLQEKFPMGVINVETIASTFATIKSKYRADYKMYNVGVIALWFLIRGTTAKFRGWEPLRNPQHGLDVMSLLQGLLGDIDKQESIFHVGDSMYEENSSPYTQLVMEAVLPAVKLAVTNSWEPRDPEPMLAFLEAWEKFLPSSVMQHILENLVMPKLTVAVDNWDPCSETVPIHAWLHLWLPLIGSRMEPLYVPIRIKLTTALQAWHPADTLAHTLLSPWQAVFDAGSWEELMVRSILPKLTLTLQELVITPAQQLLDQFKLVMVWTLAMSIHHMVGIFEINFFPKWQQVLCQWLRNDPNFEEIAQWYVNWKFVFHSELLANERIRQQFNLALEMINQTVDWASVVQCDARETIRQLRERQAELQQHAEAIAQGTQKYEADISLKEIVEAVAQQHDLRFTPKSGRLHDGLQVYGFGVVSLCVDSARQRLLVYKDGEWVSFCFEELLELHHSRRGRHWKVPMDAHACFWNAPTTIRKRQWAVLATGKL